MIENDRLRRFLFEDAPVRGHWLRLSRSWLDAREHQELDSAVMELLGESLAAAGLLAASLKFEGTLSLQVQGGDGRVSMLVAQATDARTVRGVAHVGKESAVPGETFRDLVGGARLVVSVEQGAGVEPWQGVVPLDGNSLADSLEYYFAVSEQVPTAIVLAANAETAAGLLLQKLPSPATQGEAAGADAQQAWEELALMMRTLQPEELLAWGPEELLRRLFPERDIRLFDGDAVRFACRCDRERVAGMLQGIGQAEVESILAEQGAVTVTCEFCQKPYRFDVIDAAQLFMNPAAEASKELN